ncbi:hypothetical protein DPM13_09620 [Paracoccus mutanolyticus]|uniref:Autotransporter domain-containing protein n=1 Tax=Paracoccus mutanolyticus TaxID=1499308 RepID=A0ABM6WRG7_9RHOB|nr:transporter [Paracoccus mutanolyticus]AWX93275.1 hypothetical protein DPM13_09620 [Paracoccus mutanolyticus]
MIGLTWISDGGFEISTQTMLNFNTENPDTDYTSGIEWKQEFAVGQHVGHWTIGAGGYVYSSSGRRAGLADRARRAQGGPYLGPIITYQALPADYQAFLPIIGISGSGSGSRYRLAASRSPGGLRVDLSAGTRDPHGSTIDHGIRR